MSHATVDVEEDDLNLIKYLTFILATEVYAIAIHSVREIIGVQRITPVPDGHCATSAGAINGSHASNR